MGNYLRDVLIREARMKKKKTSCTDLTDLAAVVRNWRCEYLKPS